LSFLNHFHAFCLFADWHTLKVAEVWKKKETLKSVTNREKKLAERRPVQTPLRTSKETNNKKEESDNHTHASYSTTHTHTHTYYRLLCCPASISLA
jgi:hypothetical protein